MTHTRRRFMKLAGAAAFVPAAPYIADAQGGYPNRPVHWIVGQAAGSSSDITARLIGQWLSEKLGQQFVVEVRPGATGNIATEFVVRAAPDGYTLLLMNAQNTINATLYEKLSFDFARDIAPVGLHRPRASGDGGHSVFAGQDRSRVHRLCQGKSGQDQHGIGRHRRPAARCRRAVQVHGGRGHGACALSRLNAGGDRSALRARCR